MERPNWLIHRMIQLIILFIPIGVWYATHRADVAGGVFLMLVLGVVSLGLGRRTFVNEQADHSTPIQLLGDHLVLPFQGGEAVVKLAHAVWGAASWRGDVEGVEREWLWLSLKTDRGTVLLMTDITSVAVPEAWPAQEPPADAPRLWVEPSDLLELSDMLPIPG